MNKRNKRSHWRSSPTSTVGEGQIFSERRQRRGGACDWEPSDWTQQPRPGNKPKLARKLTGKWAVAPGDRVKSTAVAIETEKAQVMAALALPEAP